MMNACMPTEAIYIHSHTMPFELGSNSNGMEKEAHHAVCVCVYLLDIIALATHRLAAPFDWQQ